MALLPSLGFIIAHDEYIKALKWVNYIPQMKHEHHIKIWKTEYYIF